MRRLTAAQLSWLVAIVDEIGIEFDRNNENMRRISMRVRRSEAASWGAINSLLSAGVIEMVEPGTAGSKPGRFRVRDEWAQHANDVLDRGTWFPFPARPRPDPDSKLVHEAVPDLHCPLCGEVRSDVVERLGLAVDEMAGDMIWNGRRMHQPRMRLKLLAALLVRFPGVVRHEHLLHALWGQFGDHEPQDPDNVIKAHISNLRRALERFGAPVEIRNNFGLGYELLFPADAEPADEVLSKSKEPAHV